MRRLVPAFVAAAVFVSATLFLLSCGGGGSGGGSSQPLVETLAAGNAHNLFIAEDGTLWAWGNNNTGQAGTDNATTFLMSPTFIDSGTDWKQVTGKGSFSLAIKNDGTLWAWGNNSSGQLGTDTSIFYLDSPVQVGSGTDWKQVSAGFDHVLALRTDGSLWAWGSNLSGQLGTDTGITQLDTPAQVGSNTGWDYVSAGYDYSLAVREDDTLWAWGTNGFGQLGTGTGGTPVTTPARIGADTDWFQVSAGQWHSLAVRDNGSLWAWGSNGAGQLGTSAFGNQLTPVPIGNGTDWKQVSAGGGHSLALKEDGTLWAWGNNFYGTLGTGTGREANTLMQVGGGPWKYISAGYYHSVGLKSDDTLWSWGSNDFARLGIGVAADKNLPVRPDTGSGWQAVSGGASFSVALRTGGELWSWGQNGAGQLGTDTGGLPMGTPILGAQGHSWDQVDIGSNHNLAIRTDGTLWAWGGNNQGRLGTSTNQSFSSPIPVGTGTWRSVSAFHEHSMGIMDDGTLWAWGAERFGKLGTDTGGANLTSPGQVAVGDTWDQVSAGMWHTLAVRSDNTLWAWGRNNYGQLGSDTGGLDVALPLQIGTDSDWSLIAAGEEHSQGIKEDGTLWGWGRSYAGTPGSFTFPVQVGSAYSDWSHISAGSFHSLALREDGTLWAWGWNSDGQVGTTTLLLYTPARIGTGSNWASVSAGHRHSLATRDDGTVWSWGDNSSGQVGDGDAWRRTPQRIY
jgi:alpha-tubulin suppressor-like RCC1 family protein